MRFIIGKLLDRLLNLLGLSFRQFVPAFFEHEIEDITLGGMGLLKHLENLAAQGLITGFTKSEAKRS